MQNDFFDKLESAKFIIVDDGSEPYCFTEWDCRKHKNDDSVILVTMTNRANSTHWTLHSNYLEKFEENRYYYILSGKLQRKIYLVF